MVTAKCPLRISLVGGSTDLQSFVDEYGLGKVYTYISISKRYDKLYRINYLKTEEVDNPNNIKNDIAREIINKFNIEPVTITFNADIPSSGSGLASSSSYTVAAVAAVCKFKKIKKSQFEICEIAREIELKFNPLTGYQDCYGCGLPSSKMMEFRGGSNIKISPVKLPQMNMLLFPTNINRSSTSILKTIDNKKSYDLLNLVDIFYDALEKNKLITAKQILDEAWKVKKGISPHIIDNELGKIEEQLRFWYDVYMLKLCGAGGGGYFFVMTDDKPRETSIKVEVDNLGVRAWDV